MALNYTRKLDNITEIEFQALFLALAVLDRTGNEFPAHMTPNSYSISAEVIRELLRKIEFVFD